MSSDALVTLDRAVRELRNLERILRPFMEDGEEMTEAVRRLISVKPASVPPASVGPISSPLGTLKTPKQIVAACPALTKNSLKKMMFRSRTNGLEAHLVRLGRRVLIDERGFGEWLRGKRGHQGLGDGRVRRCRPRHERRESPGSSASGPSRG